MSDDRVTLPMAGAQGRATPPVFEKVAIIGLGLIGGSIALAAKEVWPTGLVIGVDVKDVLEQAMVLHAIDVAADDLVVIAEADLVILAAPVSANLELLGPVAQHVEGHAVVTDVGSTKRTMVEAAGALPPRLRFVGGHPLAGAPHAGLDWARPDLFVRRPWLFTPVGDADADVLDRLFAFARGLRAEPRTLDATTHDALVASLTQLPQLTASALMHVVGERIQEDGMALAGRGLVNGTSLASTPASTWRDVCATNAAHLGDALDDLIKVLQALRQDLESGAELTRVFESAVRWRERLGAGRPRDSVDT